MIRTALALALLPAVLVLPGASGSATSASGATFPDTNGRIAFRRFLDSDKTWGALFTIRQDGTGERRVTHPPKGSVDANPDVSPDGRRIVFQRRSATSDEIWVVNADGTGLQPITQQPFAGATCDTGGYCDTAPSWSPDGLRIAFGRAFGPVRQGLIERAALFTVAADGSDVQQLTQLDLPATGEDSEPQFSPDGERLLFQRWNVRSARPGRRRGALDPRPHDHGGVAHHAVPAPGGGHPRLVAGRPQDPVPRQSRGAGRCTRRTSSPIRPNGKGLRQLTFADDGVTQYLGSSYSPDGKKIVFGRRPATGGVEADAADLFVMRIDGSHVRPVTRTGRYDSYPDWGPRP